MAAETSTDFSSLSIRPELQEALAACGYVQMTPIQQCAAEPVLNGHDVIAQAQTGSGKTAAFALGLLNKVELTSFSTQALVICPTRELSDQVANEIRRLASVMPNTRVLTLCGGKPLHDQLNSLKREPHVVVGTPGRLLKHLEKGSLNLRSIQTLVLDEADRMLDMGFLPDIRQIIEKLPRQRQTLLFSATYPDEIMAISRAIQRDPITLQAEMTPTDTPVEQVFLFAKETQKLSSLFRVLNKYQPSQALVFCNRKDSIQALCENLTDKGLQVRALHGDLEQQERDEALLLFNHQSISLLVATDVAARGLDINDLPAVINYDLSPDPDTHLHRIGRTGRAGKAGLAVTFVEPAQMHHTLKLEAVLGEAIKYTELPAVNSAQYVRLDPPMRTLLLNVGKKDKIRPGDIVGALTAGNQLSNDSIGKITVQAKIAFVSLESDKAELALNILNNSRVKKQKVRARLIA